MLASIGSESRHIWKSLVGTVTVLTFLFVNMAYVWHKSCLFWLINIDGYESWVFKGVGVHGVILVTFYQHLIYEMSDFQILFS